MRLRRKITLVAVATMTLVFVLLGTWLVAVTFRSRIEEERIRRNLARIAFAAEVKSLDLIRNPSDFPKLQQDFGRGSVFAEWALVDRSGRVVAWSLADPPPSAFMEPETIRARDYDVFAEVEAAPGVQWRLYGRTAEIGRSLGRELGEMLLAVALGAIFLVTTLYGMVDRLVLRPLGRLTAAAESLASGRAAEAVRGAERADEVGELVRSFNSMAAEVALSRRDLETRLNEALASERKAHQQLAVAERLSATGALAAGIAHEINNPLGGMMNAARSIRAGCEGGSREAEYAELILDGLERIAHTVREMLLFSRGGFRRDRPGEPAAHVGTCSDICAPGCLSRPVSHSMPPEPPGSVALDEVVAGAAGFVSHRVGKESVELTVDVPPGLPRVLGVRAEIHSVVLNLLVNALDAVEGTAAKKVSIRAARSGDSVVLAVEDTGCGMDEATAARAFDIFFTTKPPDRGTGLGLSVVHRIVTDCGGAVELDSGVGRGTTVTVRLPAAEEESEGGEAR